MNTTSGYLNFSQFIFSFTLTGTTTLSTMAFSTMTLSTMTFSITTLSMITSSTVTFSITTLSMITLHRHPKYNNFEQKEAKHYGKFSTHKPYAEFRLFCCFAECHYAECRGAISPPRQSLNSKQTAHL